MPSVQYGLLPNHRSGGPRNIGQTDQRSSVRRTLIYEDNRQDARSIGRAVTPKPGSTVKG